MRPGFSINRRQIRILTLPLLLGLSSTSDAEYLIYLKGGHFIVAEDCTFGARQEVGKPAEINKKSLLVEDCTNGKPESQIFWSTIDGHSGKVNADDIYAILGTKSLPPIKPSGTTLPLEDYLIINRGESFVNAKTIQDKEDRVYGMKRDELANLNRRDVIGIAPERLAKSRSGEGLCPGEPAEFAVSEIELIEGHLVGAITNLSKEPWRPWIDVEVRVKGRLLGKFQVEDPNVLLPNESTSIDSPIDSHVMRTRFLKALGQLKEPEAGVRLCYRKVKTTTKGPN